MTAPFPHSYFETFGWMITPDPQTPGLWHIADPDGVVFLPTLGGLTSPAALWARWRCLAARERCEDMAADLVVDAIANGFLPAFDNVVELLDAPDPKGILQQATAMVCRPDNVALSAGWKDHMAQRCNGHTLASLEASGWIQRVPGRLAGRVAALRDELHALDRRLPAARRALQRGRL